MLKTYSVIHNGVARGAAAALCVAAARRPTRTSAWQNTPPASSVPVRGALARLARAEVAGGAFGVGVRRRELGDRREVRAVERVQELAAEFERDVAVDLHALHRAQIEPYELRAGDDEASDAAVAEAHGSQFPAKTNGVQSHGR